MKRLILLAAALGIYLAATASVQAYVYVPPPPGDCQAVCCSGYYIAASPDVVCSTNGTVWTCGDFYNYTFGCGSVSGP